MLHALDGVGVAVLSLFLPDASPGFVTRVHEECDWSACDLQESLALSEARKDVDYLPASIMTSRPSRRGSAEQMRFNTFRRWWKSCKARPASLVSIGFVVINSVGEYSVGPKAQL